MASDRDSKSNESTGTQLNADQLAFAGAKVVSLVPRSGSVSLSRGLEPELCRSIISNAGCRSALPVVAPSQLEADGHKTKCKLGPFLSQVALELT